MQINQLISIASCANLLFLAIITLAKKSQPVAGYRFLAVFFMLLAFNIADNLLTDNGTYTKYPPLLIIFQPVQLAIPPALYFSVVYLTSINKKLSPLIIIHFIPYFIFIFLYTLYAIISYLPEAFTGPLNNQAPQSSSNTAGIIATILLFAQIFTYLALSAKQLNKHTKALPYFVSNIAGNDYRWLGNTIKGLSVLAIIWFFESLINQPHYSWYFSLTYLIGFYYAGIQVTRQKNVYPFSSEEAMDIAMIIATQQGEVNNTFTPPNENVAASGIEVTDAKEEITEQAEKKKVLSDDMAAHYKQALLTLMNDNKPWLDCDLTLPKLSKMLMLNTYQTSYIINKGFGENFYLFINRYRVEECKRMLESSNHTHLSILGMAYEAGFNSKTAFNTSFKKITGLSPVEYREQLMHTKSHKTGTDISTI